MSSSSSLPLSFNPLPTCYKSSRIPSERDLNTFSFPNYTKRTAKSHICFTFNKNSSEYEREENRWLREEQRWLREEQRWMREERRWEAERETLLNEIKALKLQIEELRDNNSVPNVAKLLHVLKKEVSQIAESGSSAAPLVIEAIEDAEEVVVKAEAAVEEVEEVVVVKEVIRVEEEEVKKDKEVNIKKITLRAGSEGDQVQMLQEALLKLGFYCGEEDEEFASFSSGTERAVKTWQSSIGVPETGIVTAELLERLLIDQQDRTSGFKGANGVAANSIAQTPEVPLKIVKEVPENEVSDNRVFLLGENRYEDSSRLKNKSSQSQPNNKGVVTTKCITCRGEGRLLCLECDGTGEPNIEPQFLEWVGEDTKCPYCEGHGHSVCDVCQGTGVGGA
ncbi:putative Heat shock protein DnaJ, cysteine-rich domain superfamily [Helianthus annuus]|nr:putative Heat shock protein DnaJ, cysteine-rich domain superfamily [Helianthus annuus]